MFSSTLISRMSISPPQISPYVGSNYSPITSEASMIKVSNVYYDLTFLLTFIKTSIIDDVFCINIHKGFQNRPNLKTNMKVLLVKLIVIAEQV